MATDKNMSIENLPGNNPEFKPSAQSFLPDDPGAIPPADPKIRLIQEAQHLAQRDPSVYKSLSVLLRDYQVEGATLQEQGKAPDHDAIKRAEPELRYPLEGDEKRKLDIAISAASGFFKFQTSEDDRTAERLLELLRDPGRREQGMRELDSALAAKKTRSES